MSQSVSVEDFARLKIILSQLQEQQTVITEMLESNRTLNIRFNEIMDSRHNDDLERENLFSTLEQQRFEIENFRTLNASLIDFYTCKLRTLRVSNGAQQLSFGNSTRGILVETPRKVDKDTELEETNSFTFTSSSNNSTHFLDQSTQDNIRPINSKSMNIENEKESFEYLVKRDGCLEIICPHCHRHISLIYGKH